MLKAFAGKFPKIDPSALIHDSAFILGDVEIGAGSSVWPGAVIRGDMAFIRIGKNAHIQDNCVVHSEFGSEIGDNVIVGHCAVVHSRRVGSNVMIGNNSTLLDHSEIGDYTIVAAGSIVSPEKKFPDRSLVIGSPAKRREEISERHLEQIAFSVEYYARTVKLYKEEGF